MANTKLTRNNNSGDSRRKMTWSWWIKRSKLGLGGGENSDIQYLYNQYRSADNYNSGVLFQSDDSIRFWDYGGSSNDLDLQTTRLFRDTNGFYHIVLAIDTTQATASNRIKLYINGVQETAFDVATYPAQNHEVRMGEAGSAQQQQLGVQGYGSTYQSYFDGVMSHVHFIDGTAYDATAFGSTDATTGEWQINTSPSVTYGTNGFFILKDGNSVTDASPNSNNFTVGGGTLTKTEDNPSNVFATFNPLFAYVNGGSVQRPAYSNGNNTATFDNGGLNEHAPSTLAPSSGKYYAEFKWVSSHGDGSTGVGIFATDVNTNNDINAQSYLYMGNGEKRMLNSAAAYGASWTTGDIISIALDCDNNTVTFYKNGATQGALSIASGNNYYMYCTDYDNKVVNANFGNGYFGTTAVSSAGTNASGIGIFEYDVPANFTALSTKGLNL